MFEHIVLIIILFVPKVLLSVLYIMFMTGKNGIIHRLYSTEMKSGIKRFFTGALIALLRVSVVAVGFYGVVMNIILLALNLIPGIAI